ncbi:MAG: hypothetical protein JXR37_02115 [Kiritimatiellae bacterium]|nr:hypothetical protein [Kiritimatiellia bacterium]
MPQPDLKQALRAAPLIEPEELGVVVRNVQCYEWRSFVPNPDGRTYDVLQWYYREYQGPTWLYAIDLGTGTSKKLRFPDRCQFHMSGQALGPDGKHYIASAYWYYGGRREAEKLGIPAGMQLLAYDPAANEMEDKGVIVPGLSGERRPLTCGPDGRLYGAGSYEKLGKVGVYSYDPKTGKVREYGAVGPKHRGGVWADNRIEADETYIYTLSGFTPYHLVAVNIESGENRVLLETEPGGVMHLLNGPAVEVKATIDAKEKKTYWLHAGAAIPKTGTARPWTPTADPRPALPTRPQVHWDDMVPDRTGRARLWYRPTDAPAPCEWKAVELEGLESYPIRLKCLAALRDGRIFCKAEGHHGGSLFDPATGAVTETGHCGTEAYACLVHAGKIYWTGYCYGETCVYDPDRPWNHAKGVPPGRTAAKLYSRDSNPRQLARLDKYRAIQMLSAVVGADEKLYLCGWGVRAYKGGTFCWVDPKTGEKGGIWRPFIGYRTFWLAAALDRRFIVVSTAATSDAMNNWTRSPQGKLFVWDTQTAKFVREIEPVLRAERTGPILEVRPGILMGIADDPDNKVGGILYTADIRTGTVLYRKTLPFKPAIVTSHTPHQCGYQLGPDGHIWTFLGRGDSEPHTPDALVRINPEDGRVIPVGRVKKLGNFIFVGADMYLTGTDQLRRIRGVVK